MSERCCDNGRDSASVRRGGGGAGQAAVRDPPSSPHVLCEQWGGRRAQPAAPGLLSHPNCAAPLRSAHKTTNLLLVVYDDAYTFMLEPYFVSVLFIWLFSVSVVCRKVLELSMHDIAESFCIQSSQNVYKTWLLMALLEKALLPHVVSPRSLQRRFFRLNFFPSHSGTLARALVAFWKAYREM